MAIWKTIWVFSQTDHGWTETHYRDSVDLESASIFSDALINARLVMASPLTVLRKIRVSSIDNNRIANPVNINRPGTGSPALEGPDIAGTTALYTVSAPSVGLSGNIFVRGLNDNQVQRDPNSGRDIPGPQLNGAAKNFIVKLAGNGFVMYGLEKLTGIAPLVYFNIQSIDVAADKTITMNASGLVVVARQRYVVSQVSAKDFPGLDGIVTAISDDAGHLKIRYNTKLAPGNFPLVKGRIRLAVYTSGPIVPQVNPFNKFSTRDTGKNSTAGRGRKPAQRLRLA